MNKIVIAIPKGRIRREVKNILSAADIIPDSDFFDENSRRLKFDTNIEWLSLVSVRGSDVPVLVSVGAVDIGICGSDVIVENDFDSIISPLDLKIGKCRMSLIGKERKSDIFSSPRVKIASKYPRISKRYFADKFIQAECVKLNGAVEIAINLDVAEYIIDLISSGKTMRENGLVEINKIADVSSRLIVNKASFKADRDRLEKLIDRFRRAVKD